ncbi:DNA-directed DNA polymerase epsilon, subunit B [Arachnomyces sp. PD_36]|nr:DNA-directed DNA polymerase epsilon, subunit B [Arachnomyces sp. PD_36]
MSRGNLPPADEVPSSSPAFGTPAFPIRTRKSNNTVTTASILPISLPPSTLRSVAFRTFTKKHNLTISSSALQTLSTFVGKNCGSGWREEGLAELVLDEVAKMWKKSGGGVIVEDKAEQNLLKTILQGLESNMSGGKVVAGKNPGHGSHTGAKTSGVRHDSTSNALNGSGPDISQGGLGLQETSEEEDGEDELIDTRKWMKVIGAYEQPRLIYNVGKKHFERSTVAPSLFPPPSHKISLFRNRYNLVYQRLLRNESFQTPSIMSSNRPSLQRTASTMATAQQSYSLTSIANLLGRSGTFHLLLGLLAIAPAGGLSITDLTGTIMLDLSHAQPVPVDGAWFAPGMIVLVHGVYEEEENPTGSILGGNSGVGGTIGGRFVGASIAGPPCERREATLGTDSRHAGGEPSSTGGFGWVDFLGIGSERALGPRMRRLERKCLGAEAGSDQQPGSRTIAIMSEVHLDNPKALAALKKVFRLYASLPDDEIPFAFVMIGNFVQNPAISRGGGGGGIEYKEYFDSLASILGEYPSLLRNSKFVFVPGDNDPWASAFSSGAATTIPRAPIPDLFTSRVKRAFDAANAKSEKRESHKVAGEASWTSNPARLSIFGPAQEIVVFRDDISSRFRRTAVSFNVEKKEDAESTPPPDVLEPEGEAMDQIRGADDDDDGMDMDASAKDAESHLPTAKEQPENPNHPPSISTLKARKLVKTLLDQGTLSPFPINTRPVLWDYGSSLHLYPLPTAIILADAEAAPFAVTYEGCHVVNPGVLVPRGRRGFARWAEFDILKRKGKIREERF